ncbi:MAG: NUDIX hydrolase [Parcubacteria group bacterium]|jgi:ADP-ribose pyrophosphatase YjhB (NUDIX family)
MRIPKNISLNKEGQYCIECFSEKVERVYKNNLTYYHCATCGKTSERSLVIDNKIVWWIDEATREYWHESVGIFVFNSENKVLFFERTIYPFAFAIPAGHLDIGEDAKMATRRELQEEAGIETNKITLFSEEDVLGDKCRRGADNHRWHLYTTSIKNNAEIKINDEGIKPIWLSLKEALQKKLVYPVRYFIEKYGDKLLA